MEPEQVLALAVQVGARGVQVIGSGASVVGCGGVASGDEADDCAVEVVDGEGEPVAEPVDQRSGAGALGEAGGEQLLVGGAEAAEVVDEGGPGAQDWG